ncbi:MAG: hypothetical protein LQ340_000736 [Diploschistes diacapsis]|nr:MAG: hypothetical protein LQ340_000736 [Diploschistes diacapsis]
MEDLVHRLGGRLLFAIPKKGRLQQPTLDLLSGSSIEFKREHRLDIALVKNHDIALVFLPAADIPTFVGEGRVDLGITGQDQVSEYEADASSVGASGVVEVLNLGFGKCKLQVQVPEESKFQSARDLIGHRLATSFMGLTERFFAKLEGTNGQSANGEAVVVGKLKTKIRSLGGSVETACTLGVADGIVDLVESGETMRAAGLRAVDTVIDSAAVLIRSKTSSNQKLIDLITSRIKGFINAQKYALCQYNIPRSTLQEAKKITPGKTAPSVTPLESPGWVAVSAMVLKEEMAPVMDRLREVGAEGILEVAISNSRTD